MAYMVNFQLFVVMAGGFEVVAFITSGVVVVVAY